MFVKSDKPVARRRAGLPRARLVRFIRGREGVAIVDFAMVAPILVMILLGGVEVGRLALLNQKLSRVSTSVSDLVARSETVTEDDIDQVFIAAQMSMRPFAIGDQGLIFISSVSTQADPDDPRINWQRNGGGTASATSTVGVEGGPATLPHGFTMVANRNVIVSEFFYHYEPFFFGGFFEERDMRHFAVHRPRLGALNSVAANP